MITPEAKKAMDDWKATRSPSLKPCPFCGGEAKVRKYLVTLAGEKKYSLTHTCGGVYGASKVFSMCGAGFETKGEAIEAWNRRTDDERKTD